jgi:malonyl CoA-acyl carrier protein transacylase
VVLQANGSDRLLGFELKSDGTQNQCLKLGYNAQPKPLIEGVTVGKGTYQPITMNGKEVYRFAVQLVPEIIDKALFRANLKVEQIDWLLLHQANQRIIDAVAQRLNIPAQKLSAISPAMATPLPLPFPLPWTKPCGKVRFNCMISLLPLASVLVSLGEPQFSMGQVKEQRAEEKFMTKTAWVFPGQGSQDIGMGVDLLDLSYAKGKFEQAEEILGWSVLEICQDESDKVSQTLYTQPSMYVVESILADLMRERGQQPDLVAGHSLGEYIALYVAGVFDWQAGLRLVKRRAELMDSAAGGMMAALIGFDRDQLEQQIKQNPDVVLANDNSSAQVVISGTPTAVEAVLSQVKAKRAIPLNVSGAFHSPLWQQQQLSSGKSWNLSNFNQLRCQSCLIQNQYQLLMPLF